MVIETGKWSIVDGFDLDLPLVVPSNKQTSAAFHSAVPAQHSQWKQV
jgi:hypothetical protein